jgi:hypothetical protein
MTLPTNTTPTYTIKIPSTGKDFKFRPFLVKDEKALMIAQESEDVGVMLDTVKDVIRSCAKSDIDVDSLASFDIEYIFLQMRAKSVGEIVELVFACDEDHGADNDKARATVQINLEDVKVQYPEGHTNKIALFGDVGIVMKYPTIDTLKRLETSNSTDVDVMFDVMSDCIDYIYDGEQVFPAKETDKHELIDFLNNLTNQQFASVQKFFQTMPQLRAYVTYTCPVCGKVHNKYLEGLSSFF